MTTAATLLLHLVADLVRSDCSMSEPNIVGLRDAFEATPEAVMTRYGLDRATEELLATMDRQLIGERVRLELLGAPLSLWSAPAAPKPVPVTAIVADLIRSDVDAKIPAGWPSLVARFKADPATVMAAYGLDDAERETLRSGDRARIGELVRREIVTTPGAKPTDLWAEPVTSVDVFPPPGGLHAAPNQSFNIQVIGALSDAEIHFQSTDRLNHFVFPLGGGTLGFTASIALTLDLSALDEEDYDILIYNGRRFGPITALKSVPVSKP